MTSIRDKKFPMVPYGCLYIDASWKDVLSAIPFSMEPSHRRSLMEHKLDQLWNHAHATPSPILPCLSVRTAFDLYLSVKNYPRGSEMVFCAINIPDMARIVRHHGIKLVSLDVDMETMTPKVEHLESLITSKTVAVLLAHLYGRWIDLEDLIRVAKRHRLDILEDCAEAFCGVQNHGNPAADVSFFSFGLIKSYTAFGGAIAVVRNPILLTKMRTLHHSYPIRARSVYLKKLLKYSMIMTALNSPFLIKHLTMCFRALGVNHRDLIVNYIRGFPNDFFGNIRMRPSIALLCMLYRRLKNFDSDAFNLGRIKGDFVSERLPPGIQGVGLKAKKCNYWLFPIVVDDPERVLKELRARGVDAYRGATQLNLIESDVALPRSLSNPSERVHQVLDASSKTAESTDNLSRCGESRGGKAESLKSGLDRGRGLQQGQWKAKDVCSASATPLTFSREVPEKSNSDVGTSQELRESSRHIRNSIDRGTVNRRQTIGLSPDHVDDSQGMSLQSFNGDSANYANANSKEVTRKSNNISRDLPWLVEGQNSNNYSIPCTVSPSSPGSCRNTRIPSKSQELPHFAVAHDDISAAIHAESHPIQFTPTPHYGAPSASRQSVTDLSSVTLQHQHDYQESNGQCLPGGSSSEDTCLQSGGTCGRDTPPCDQPTMKCEPNHYSALIPRLNHSSRIEDSSNHSSDEPVAHSTKPQRLPESSFSNTDPAFAGVSQAMPEQSSETPMRGVGESPGAMAGKYPNEARYLIDHVVYLPVHRKVPFHYLEQICAVLEDVASMLDKEKSVKVRSKL